MNFVLFYYLIFLNLPVFRFARFPSRVKKLERIYPQNTNFTRDLFSTLSSYLGADSSAHFWIKKNSSQNGVQKPRRENRRSKIFMSAWFCVHPLKNRFSSFNFFYGLYYIFFFLKFQGFLVFLYLEFVTNQQSKFMEFKTH